MPRGVPRCRHDWEKVGPAPSFRGEQQVLWRCALCGKEQETYCDVDMNDPYKSVRK